MSKRNGCEWVVACYKSEMSERDCSQFSESVNCWFENHYLWKIQLKNKIIKLFVYVLELCKSNWFPRLCVMYVSVALTVWPLTLRVWLMLTFPAEKYWRKQILSDSPTHTNTLIHICTCMHGGKQPLFVMCITHIQLKWLADGGQLWNA